MSIFDFRLSTEFRKLFVEIYFKFQLSQFSTIVEKKNKQQILLRENGMEVNKLTAGNKERQKGNNTHRCCWTTFIK